MTPKDILRAKKEVERIASDLEKKGLIQRTTISLSHPKKRARWRLLAGFILMSFLVVFLLSRPELLPDVLDIQTLVKAMTGTRPASPLLADTPTLAPPTAAPTLPPAALSITPQVTTPKQQQQLNQALGFPIEVAQPKFQISFTIDKIEIKADILTFFISIKRTGPDPLPWYDDQNNLPRIFLQANGQAYPALEVNGVFAVERTDLQPGQTYQGWIRFARPAADQFTFNYPDMAATAINLAGSGR